MQLTQIAMLSVAIVTLASLLGCFSIPSRTPTTIQPTFDNSGGRYNPLPTRVTVVFPEEIDMETVTASDFVVRDTCSGAAVTVSSLQKADETVTINLQNTNLCTQGESFTVKVKYSGIRFADDTRKGKGSQTYTYTFDTTPPTVSAAILTMSGLTTNGSFLFTSVPAYITYTFSSDVDLSSIASTDFTIDTTGQTDCSTMPTVGTLVKSSTNKTVRVPLVGASCADGESFKVTLTDDSVSDSTKNGAGGLAANTGPATPLEFDIAYWGSGVSAVSVGGGSTSADGTYGVGADIDIAVTFDANVEVTGSPRLQLNVTGGGTRYATYESGSGTTELLFRYTVQSGDAAADLDYASTSALQLNGGAIFLENSAGGIPATRTLPTPGATDSLADLKDIVINTVAVTLDSSTPAGPTDTWGSGARNILFEFSDELDPTSIDPSDLSVVGDSCVGVPVVQSATLGGASNNEITFELSDNTCANGETYTLSLDPTTVDSVSASPATGSAISIEVTSDTDAPTLALGAPSPSALKSTGSVVYTVTYSGATAVTLTDTDVQFAGSSTDCVATIGGAGTITRTITITDCSATGDVQISVNAATASNALGNPAEAVNEGDIVDFAADNTELPDPTEDLPTLGLNEVYVEDVASSITLNFAGDILGSQVDVASALALACDSGGGANPVSFSLSRASAEDAVLTPTEASSDFVYDATCTIVGTDVPDHVDNLHSFSPITFKVASTPTATSGPSGLISLATATGDGTLGDLVFSNPMNTGAVTVSNVTLTCDLLPIVITSLSAAPGDTDFTIDFDETDANWLSLVGGETCELEVSTAVTNSLGVTLASPQTFTFTTEP